MSNSWNSSFFYFFTELRHFMEIDSTETIERKSYFLCSIRKYHLSLQTAKLKTIVGDRIQNEPVVSYSLFIKNTK